jgi:ABC-type transport system involved in multi-copper enzyme maturation permease subunit
MPKEPDNPISILSFFPEIIIVTLFVLLSPVWCAQLVYKGYVVYGCLVLSIAIMGTVGFVWCMIKRRRFAALAVMVAILLAYFLILSCIPPNVRDTIGQEPRTTNQNSPGGASNTTPQTDERRAALLGGAT